MNHINTINNNCRVISHGVLSTGEDWRIAIWNDSKYHFETRWDADCGWINRCWSYNLQEAFKYRDCYDMIMGGGR